MKKVSTLLQGATGWADQTATVSILLDEVTGDQSICYTSAEDKLAKKRGEMIYLSDKDFELIKKIFRLED